MMVVVCFRQDRERAGLLEALSTSIGLGSAPLGEVRDMRSFRWSRVSFGEPCSIPSARAVAEACACTARSSRRIGSRYHLLLLLD